MAYGLQGWFQIIICCLGSLLYYFPGLAYALIVINRSDVADRMKINFSKVISTVKDHGNTSAASIPLAG